MDNNNFYFVVKIDSNHDIKPTRVVNDKPTLHATAIGKVLLASLDEEELQRFIRENNLLKRFTSVLSRK
jgi:DNA-binding IclR family transcriptional regulator